MPTKQQLDKAAWDWAERIELTELSEEHLRIAYRLNLKSCKPFCRRNCRGNPYCMYGLGEKKWLNEIQADTWHEVDDPNNERREPGSFSGLKNLGATCYVNSFLQVWYNNPDFRKAIYLWNPIIDPQEMSIDDPEWKPETGIGNLQLIFALLQFSNRRFIDPTPLITSLGLNASLQQDAQEFCKLFISHLEERLSLQIDPQVQSAMQNLYQGRYSYVVSCNSCHTESACPATFYELDLNIKGHKNLSECIKEFLKEELLENNEQYYCSICQKKQNATRSVVLEKLPTVLNLQLLRFVFDRQTNRKKKINSFLQFPEMLDMSEYWNTNQDCLYQLSAVLIHKGPSAYSGHYVAHIRDRPSGSWYKFNDEYVDKMTTKTLGTVDAETGSGKAPKPIRGNHSSNNAYMLVYTLQDNKNGHGGEVANDDWRLPDYLLNAVEKDNNIFEEWIVELTSMRDQCILDGKNRQEEIKHLYTKLTQTEGVPSEFISVDWLMKWLGNETDIKEIEHEKFQCPHLNLNPHHVTKMKLVNSEAADMLFSTYGGSIRFKDSLCRECVAERCQQIKQKQQLTEENKIITALLKQPIINEAYWIGKSSLKNWRKILSSETSSNNSDDTLNTDNGDNADGGEDSNEESMHNFNEDINCRHGSLHPDEKARKLILPEVWDILRNHFPSAPTFNSKAQVCSICEVEEKKEDNQHFRQIALSRKNLLCDFTYQRNRPLWTIIDQHMSFYIVSNEFFIKWKMFIKEPNSNTMVDNVNNAAIICTHEKLLYRPHYSPQLTLLWEKEWKLLEKCITLDVPITITSTPKGTLVTNPPVCEVCSSDKSLHSQHTISYSNAKIFVRKVIRVKKEKASDNEGEDEASPPQSKKAKLDDETLMLVRRSNRRRRQRDEKEVYITSTDTLRRLKRQLLRLFGILPCEQTIKDPFGNVYEDDESTLAHLGIVPDSELILEVDENVNDGHNIDDITPLDSAPETGFKGTNLVGNT